MLLPLELLHQILLTALAHPLHGPPSDLPAFLALNHATHAQLSSPHTSASIFHAKFDLDAVARRFGPAALAPHVLAAELARRFLALRRIRAHAHAPAHVLYPEMTHDLWIAYLMLLENDHRNAAQLEWANARAYARRLIVDTMAIQAHSTKWPAETEHAALATWVLWLTESDDTVADETDAQCEELVRALSPCVFTAFMYPSTHAQFNLFHLPQPADAPLSQLMAERMMSPHPLIEARTELALVPHFHRSAAAPLRLQPPLLTPTAIALFSARNNGPYDENDEAYPLDAAAAAAANAAATAAGTGLPAWLGTTHRAAMALHNRTGRVRFPARLPSAAHDADFVRLRGTVDMFAGGAREWAAPLAPGALDGVWNGIVRGPDLDEYDKLIQRLIQRHPHSPPTGAQWRMYQRPAQWRLHEYHCLASAGGVPLSVPGGRRGATSGVLPPGEPDEPSNGSEVLAAWFPDGYTVDELPDGGLRVWDPLRAAHTTYARFRADAPPAADDVLDTIFIGKPDDEWMAAWGHYAVYGRVRRVDGLVVMRRDGVRAAPVPAPAPGGAQRAQVPLNVNGFGRHVFYGYVHAGAQWIGRWRTTAVPPGFPGLAGSFMVHRCPDE